jgi:amidase
VAAGDVPIAHGNDGLGSIRIPAACCGLVGIKPGLRVIPADIGADSWSDTSENGPLATTVADLALAYSVMADDPAAAHVVEPERVRIAWSAKSPAAGMPAAKEWANAAQSTADLLGELGHHVTHRSPHYPASLLTTTALRFWTINAAQDADQFVDQSRLEPRNRRHVKVGRALRRRGLPQAAREHWRANAEAFFADTDVLLTPTLARTPLKAKEWSRGGWLPSLLANVRYAPYAAPWNFVGWPAMSVPAGLDKAGHPLGVQLVGRPGSERLLLGLARQIEQRRPWPRTALL